VTLRHLKNYAYQKCFKVQQNKPVELKWTAPASKQKTIKCVVNDLSQPALITFWNLNLNENILVKEVIATIIHISQLYPFDFPLLPTRPSGQFCFFNKTGSGFQNFEKWRYILISNPTKSLYAEFQVSKLFGSIDRRFHI